MWKFFKELFGSTTSVDKVVTTAADGIYNGLDKLVYTDEEKSDALAKGREVFLEYAKIALDQNSIRSITRRWLAFSIVGPTMLFAIFSGILFPFLPDYANHLWMMAQSLSPWAGGILVFYFGPHIIGSIPK